MATLTLSDKVTALAKERATEEGFASVEEFLEALILAESPGPAPEHLSVRSHEQLVALLREGLASPAREVSPADFDRRRAELIARYGKSKAG
jgi:hypothetical protein